MANKDLEELSEKILNKEIEASEDMIFDLAYSLMHKNFYNETTANNLLQHATNTKDEYIKNTVEYDIQLAKEKHSPIKTNDINQNM